MLEHAAQMASAVSVPLNIDSERLFTEDLSALGAMVEAIADTGAAGCSIEDYRPDTQSIDPLERAVARVGAAAEAATASGLVLTARAEAFLYTDADLDEVIERLVRYREAGADVVYAPACTRPPTSSGWSANSTVRSMSCCGPMVPASTSWPVWGSDVSRPEGR